MKKIKEFIKKIGNKKYCLLSLFLAGLLLFAVVSGLNGSKSAKTEVNAISAPTTKNLDLNGVTYNYKYSLNDLRNDGFFNNPIYNHWFTIYSDTESNVNMSLSGLLDNNYSADDYSYAEEYIGEMFEFKSKNQSIDYNVERIDKSNTSNVNPLLSFSFNTLTNLTSISFNPDKYFLLPKVDNSYRYGGYVLSFYFLKDDFIYSNGSDIEYLNSNSIIYNIYTTNQIKLNVNLPNYKGYSLRLIQCTSPIDNDSTEEGYTENLYIKMTYSEVTDAFDGLGASNDVSVILNNLNFIENPSSNVITYTSEINSDEEIFKGYILLSENKFDADLFNYLDNTIPNPSIVVPLSDTYLGGNFNKKYPINNIYYFALRVPFDGAYLGGFRHSYDNSTSLNDSIFFKRYNEDKITYKNQNRLLYLTDFESLKANYNNTTYKALSAQVENILYDVNYVGNTEDIEFNEKVEEDFINLIKTTGLGAFLGLLIGLIFGNPGLGAAIGAGWGLIAGIFPLLIDGLQAIFGKNFLSGLYDFFKSITQYFVNIVDSFINFLISIITNPVVLILIVIFAILYIIYYFQKK